MVVLYCHPDKEVSDVLSYCTAAHTPDRFVTGSVRSGRRAGLRRRLARRAGRASPPRGGGGLARRRLLPAVDAVGLPRPGHQYGWVLPGGRGPRVSLVGLARPTTLYAQDRSLLQGPPAATRISVP